MIDATSTHSVVPFPQSPPTEPSEALLQARHLFCSLETWLSSTPTLELPLHLVERQQECKGRQLQRMLLQAHVQHRGTGDVGPVLRVIQATASCFYTRHRLQRRTLKTIFGPIDLDRMAYSHDGASSIHPLDEAMQLPARSFSYELQKRLVKAAVQGPFRESTERTHEFSGLTVPKRSLEQIVQEAAQDFDAFYAQRPPEPSQPAASILVVAVDCKGIPIVQPHYTKLPAGLPQGPKTNRKQMATVAAVFTREPWIRTPEQVVASLFRIDTNTGAHPSPPPRPEHKRVWASLLKGKEAVINEVVLEVQRRDPGGCKTLVALTDGERAKSWSAKN
jgi:hypothetical protein